MALGLKNAQKIGDWTVAKLVRFIQDQVQANPQPIATGQSVDTMTFVERAEFQGDVAFTLTQRTVGAAGSASALPATPSNYIRVLDSSGTVYVIPAYAAS